MSIPVLQGDFSTAKFRQYVLQMMQTIAGSSGATNPQLTQLIADVEKLNAGLSSVDSFGKYGFQTGLSTIDDGVGTITYTNQALATDKKGALLIATQNESNIFSYRPLSIDGSRNLKVNVSAADLATFNPAEDFDNNGAPLRVTNDDHFLMTRDSGPTNYIGYERYFSLVSTSSNNLTLVNAGNTNVGAITVQNTVTTHRYLKIFNASQTAAVTMGTTLANLQIGIPPNQTVTLTPASGIIFRNGLVIAMTTGAALNNNTSVTAGDMTVSISYVY